MKKKTHYLHWCTKERRLSRDAVIIEYVNNVNLLAKYLTYIDEGEAYTYQK